MSEATRTPSEPQASGSKLPRQLSATALWLLMINGMVGAGIFGVPAAAARLAGDLSPLLFLLCAFIIAPIMLCFAELASATRESGGPARYVGAAFGPLAEFQTGWLLYLARLTAFAANLNLLLLTFAYFWPVLESGVPRMLGLALITLLLAWVNIVGVRQAMRFLGSLTLLKLGPLFLLAAVGLSWMFWSTPVPRPPWPGAGMDLGAAVLLMIYAYVGFESGLIPGGEARNPQRDMPRALLLALAVCAVLYALLQWICLLAVDDLASSTRPLVDLGEALMGPIGGALLVVAVIASVGGNLLGSMFSAPRITHALATERLLPAVLARVHQNHQTPLISIVCYAVLAWLLASSGSFEWLAITSVLARLLIFLASIASLPRVRRQAAPDALRLPGSNAIALIAFTVCILLISQVSWTHVLATAMLIAGGSLLYALRLR